MAADCTDVRWQQSCASARFVYAHAGVVVAAAHSVCSPGLGLLLLSGKLQQGQQLFPDSSLQCFVQIKKVCEAAEAAGGSWPGPRRVPSHPSKAPPGWICRELEGGMLRAQ